MTNPAITNDARTCEHQVHPLQIPKALLDHAKRAAYFDGVKPSEIRRSLARACGKRLPDALQRPNTDDAWFNQFLRDPIALKHWFDAGRVPRADILRGGQIRVDGQGPIGLGHQLIFAHHWAGGPISILSSALRHIAKLDGRIDARILDSDIIDLPDAYPDWVHESLARRNSGLVRWAASAHKILRDVKDDDKSDAVTQHVAVILWILAGLFGQPGILDAYGAEWPGIPNAMETVAGADVAPEDDCVALAECIGIIVASQIFTEDYTRLRHATGHDIRRQRDQDAVSNLKRLREQINSSLFAARHHATERDRMVIQMRANALRSRIARIAHDPSAATALQELIPWWLEHLQSVCAAVSTNPMMTPARDAALEGMTVQESILKLIEEGLEAQRKAENRLRRLAESPIEHAQKLGPAAQAFESAQKEVSEVAISARKAIAIAHTNVVEASQPAWQDEAKPSAQEPKGHDDAEQTDWRHIAEDLERSLQAEQDKNRAAGETIARLQFRIDAMDPDAAGAMIPTDLLMHRLDTIRNPTPEAALLAACAARPHLRVLDSAWSSVRKASEFTKGVKLLRMLLLLGGEYLAAARDGTSDAQSRRIFGQEGYRAGESDSIRACGDCMDARTFVVDGEAIVMEKHLAIGVSPDERETLRVHFERIGGKIVIGHCGHHLPIGRKV